MISTPSSVGLFLWMVFLVILYLMPSLVAVFRGVRRTGGLAILNLLLGWTVLGWIGALIWAVQAETNDDVRRRDPNTWTHGVPPEPSHDTMHKLGRWLGSLAAPKR